MNVGRICSPNVVVAEPLASLREAALLMRNKHAGALIVVEKSGDITRPVGILTDRGIVTMDDILGVVSTELGNLAEAMRWGRKRELAARKPI